MVPDARAAVGLRYVLVHCYADVEEATVWHTLDQLDDLRAFAAPVVAPLAAHDASED